MGCFVLLVWMVLAGIVWWILDAVSWGHPVLFISAAAVVWVAQRTLRKIRRTRKRAEANADTFSVRLPGLGAEVGIEASRPGRVHGEIQGRLAGIRDAKEVKALIETGHLDGEPRLVFNIEAGADLRWVGGYRMGVAEILPEAVVQRAHTPQKGSTVA
jgi:hypothetical protein